MQIGKKRSFLSKPNNRTYIPVDNIYYDNGATTFYNTCAYIDTGISPDINHEYEIVFSHFNSSPSWGCIFDAGNIDIGQQYTFIGFRNSPYSIRGKMCNHVGDTGYFYPSKTISMNTEYTFILNKDQFKIDGTVVSSGFAHNIVSSGVSNMMLACNHDNSGYYTCPRIRFKKFIIRNVTSGAEICHLIAAKDLNTMHYGMYDTVRNMFFDSADQTKLWQGVDLT